MKSVTACFWEIAYVFAFFLFGGTAFSETLDRIDFGNVESETAHALRAGTEIGFFRPEFLNGKEPASFQSALRTARQILPLRESDWTSDGVFFTLKVRPEGTNYLSFLFCGNSASTNLLILYVDGKQLGYRHLGDYDVLHHGGNSAGGARPYCVTTCLPESVTRGRTQIQFELRMTGRIWGYGENFEQFQKVIDGPSVPFFEAVTHTEPFWEVLRAENALPLAPRMEDCPIRESSGEEVLDRILERVNRELTNFLRESESRPLSQQKAEFLAKGWSLPGSPVFRNERVLPAILAAGDAYCLRQLETESLAWADPGQFNSDWFGTGPLAEAVLRLNSQAFQAALDENLTLPDGSARTRRELWANLFSAGVRWETQHRRQFTNQSMIIDWNLQRMNRALRLVDASKALPEAQTRRYLHESMGLLPWLGCETADGPARPYGEEFFQLTPRGLTRELGYVGSYGEVLDWGSAIYLSTCEFDEKGRLLVESGDPEIRRQLIRMAHARAVFRYPAPDDEGFRAMRLETAVGWRDSALVGPVLYGARTGKEGAASRLPWVTRDDESLAAFAQMLEDGQFFPLVSDLLKDGSLRVSNVLIEIPQQYAFLKKRIEKKRSSKTDAFNARRLPMTDGQPDFIFTDETDGVVAVKKGSEILYVSLYWRARFGVNGLSKVHFMTPFFEHFATVKNRTKFTPMEDGTVFRRPNWTSFGFRQDYGVHYPSRMESLHRDEALPVAKMPTFVNDFRLGADNLFAGRGEYCEVEYGDWFIAMNLSTEKTFRCERLQCEIPPQETRILWQGKELAVPEIP